MTECAVSLSVEFPISEEVREVKPFIHSTIICCSFSVEGILSPGNEVMSQMLEIGRDDREATIQCGGKASIHICNLGEFNCKCSTRKEEER